MCVWHVSIDSGSSSPTRKAAVAASRTGIYVRTVEVSTLIDIRLTRVLGIGPDNRTKFLT
jgi:hypothetical protein